MEQQYVQMTLNDWVALKGKLEEELRGAAASFVRIGYLLRQIDETEGYKNDGSGSLSEWAYDNYGLSRSQVSRFISINKEFSIGGYSDQLRLEYSRFGSAKLTEMLALPDADREMVGPEMKREDIRELKKLNKEAAEELVELGTEEPQETDTEVAAGAEDSPADGQNETKAEVSANNVAAGDEDTPAAGAEEETEPPTEEEPVQASADGPKEPTVLPQHVWILEFFRENGELMNELFSSNAYIEGNTDGMKEIVNPAGARTYKHGLTIVSFLDARIMVKVFPAAPAPMSWEGFFKIASEIFGDRISGKDTYRNVFGADPAQEKEPETKKPEKKPPAAGKKEKENKAAGKPADKHREPAKPDPVVALAQQEEPAAVQEEHETGQKMPDQDNDLPKNAEKCPEEARNCAEKAESDQGDNQVEQVEIDEILPAPAGTDRLTELKDKFGEALATLRIQLDSNNFENMEIVIRRLETLRVRLISAKEEKGE